MAFPFFNSKKSAQRSHFAHAKDFPMGLVLDSAKAQLVFSLEQGLLVANPENPYLQEATEASLDFLDTPIASGIKEKEKETGKKSLSETDEKPTKKRAKKAKTTRAEDPALSGPENAATETPQNESLKTPLIETSIEAPFEEASFEHCENAPSAKPKKMSEAKRLAQLEQTEALSKKQEAKAKKATPEKQPQELVPEPVQPVEDTLPEPSFNKNANESANQDNDDNAQEPAIELESPPSEEPELHLERIETLPETSPQIPLSFPLTAVSGPKQLIARTLPSQDASTSSVQPAYALSIKSTWASPQTPAPQAKAQEPQILEPDDIFFDLQPLSDVILQPDTLVATEAHEQPKEQPCEQEEALTKTHLSLQALAQTPSALRTQVSENEPSPPKSTQSLSILHLTAGFNPNSNFEEDFLGATFDDTENDLLDIGPELGLSHPGLITLSSSDPMADNPDRTLLFDESRIHAQGAQLVRILYTLDKACLLLLEKHPEQESRLALAVDNGQALAILKELPWQDPDTLAIQMEVTRLPKKMLCAVNLGAWQGIICEDPRGVRLEAEVTAVE